MRHARVLRLLDERFRLFGGASWERNEFAGFNSRVLAEAGASWIARKSDRTELDLDAGLTWTDESRLIGPDQESFGAVLAADGHWHVTKTLAVRERLSFFPNFDESSAWRLRSQTDAELSVATAWSVKLAYTYSRENQPAPGFRKSDTVFSTSLVWKR